MGLTMALSKAFLSNDRRDAARVPPRPWKPGVSKSSTGNRLSLMSLLWRRIPILFVASSAALVACDAQARQGRGGGDPVQVTDSAGIAIVANRFPRHQSADVEPDPLLVLGEGAAGADRDGVFYADIRGVQVIDDSLVAVVDWGSKQLMVAARGGEAGGR